MSGSIFWHDYETFGINPRVDRPAQFAGVRTDMELNEIDKPVMIYCKPSLDFLPSPESCVITGITPQFCLSNGVFERQFASVIERELGRENTISVGYNNIRFDDEVTRYLFWRNLIDPYAREWKNGCSRWDFLGVMRALYALKPDSISWPNDDGIVNFKLESLCKSNLIVHKNAHDALSDVRATISLARFIKKVEPRFYEYCLALRNKNRVRDQLSLVNKRPTIHVSSMYGLERACLAIVWPLAMHPTNQNEVIVWDLLDDPKILQDLSADEIKFRLFTRTDELPQDVSRLPLKTIGLNKSPFVANDLRVLSSARAAQLNIDLDIILRHAENAKKLSLSSNIWRDVYARIPYGDVDVDEDLYGKFLTDIDRQKLDVIRSKEKGDLVSDNYDFQDSRLDELVFRYRARNFPETLNHDELKRWKYICHKKISHKLEEFWNNFGSLYSVADANQTHVLNDLKIWIESMNLDE